MATLRHTLLAALSLPLSTPLMGNDELCSLSAMRPFTAGPWLLCKADDTADIAAIILSNLLSSPYLPPTTFRPRDLENMANLLIEKHSMWRKLHFGERFPWLSDPSTQKWDGFEDFIAIGHFSEDGEAPLLHWGDEDDGVKLYRRPRGRECIVRRVNHRDAWCAFPLYWDDEVGKWQEGWSVISPYNGNTNIGCLKAPLMYLKAWIQWGVLPPRSYAFPHDPEPLSVEAELYEIVNSRDTAERENGALGLIDYGGMEINFHNYYQDTYKLAWDKYQSTRHLERAIRDGMSGDDLMIALSRDFGAWMCVRTDVWPTSSARGPLIHLNDDCHSTSAFHSLPTEILVSILSHLSVHHYAPLLSVSRSVRYLCLNGVFDATVKHEILVADGSLRWILPVTTMSGEEEAFHAACLTWLPPSRQTSPNECSVTPIHQEHFPHFAFIREAWMQDSMRNRRRLWSITKQFEQLWWDYRTEGWRNDVFVPKPLPDEDSDDDYQSEDGLEAH
ncbi:hypothetical protein HGRIS_009068 [Hohenbuehelia grisea]|uniref:F-box domain-containing protein n=1 Tax=Hohenbuehelia grisea TaxID=104357 RepID=A0ABR3J004_9AGAR